MVFYNIVERKAQLMDRRKNKRIFIAVTCLLTVAMLSGCTDSKPVVTGPSGIPSQSETNNKEVTPEITPTPIVDVPEDRYDSRTAARSADRELLNDTISGTEYVFNPFYATSEGDLVIVDKTQLKLFDVDAKGKAVGGINAPCLAYMIEQIPVEQTTDTAEWNAYRIVLKEGIKFADGTPVTAEDVLFTAKILANPEYETPSTLGQMKLLGMDEFYTQISEETRELGDKYAHVDINSDGSTPEGVDEAEWKEVWDSFDDAGILMTKDIVKYVNEQYPLDAYVQTYLSTKLTYSHIQADESLQILYAMRLWGGYAKKYVSSTNIMTDLTGAEHDLNENPLTYEDFWVLIRDFYGYNFSSVDGLNYESPYAYSGKYFEDYLAEAYCENHKGVDEIKGLTIGQREFEDGAVRTCIEVVLDKNEDLSKLNMYVAEKALYEKDVKNNSVAGGAGEYTVTKVSEEGIELTANEDYLLGSPEYKSILYTIDNGEDGDEMD